MELLTLIPFGIELFGDLYLINRGRKDIHWSIRIIMFLMVSIDHNASTFGNVVIQTDFLLWCLAPYAFFDIALNKLRGKPWGYLNNTKYWDRNLVRLNPWFVLCLRVIAFLGILWLANLAFK